MTRSVHFGDNAWLICYDISNPRRLGRVHRLLKKTAIPIQYSVYLAWLSTPARENLVTQLATIIDPRADDIRLYHLPASAELATLGRQLLPGGVHLFQSGARLTDNDAES